MMDSDLFAPAYRLDWIHEQVGGALSVDTENLNYLNETMEAREDELNKKSRRNFYVLLFAFTSFLLFAIAEIFGAFLSNSLSLLGDASTMIVDSLTYVFNMYSEYRKPVAKDDRLETLKLETFPPFISVVILLGVCLWILQDAVQTIVKGEKTEKVDDTIMFIFSSINLFFDILNLAFFFVSGQESILNIFGKETSNKPQKLTTNTNMCSAYTHVIADTFRSIAVLLSALLSKTTNSIDPEVADAWAAIIVSCIIFLTVIPLFVQLYSNIRDIRDLTIAPRDLSGEEYLLEDQR